MSNPPRVTIDPYAHMSRVPPAAMVNWYDPDNERNRKPGIARPFTPEKIGPRARDTRLGAEINIADRFEAFLLADGEKKVVEAADTRTPNSAIFTFAKEDHTMANTLRARLLKDNAVLFAGYRVPHPLFAKFELRVQTDGSCTPREAVVKACSGIVQDLAQLSKEFTKEFELRKIVGGSGAGN